MEVESDRCRLLAIEWKATDWHLKSARQGPDLQIEAPHILIVQVQEERRVAQYW